MLALQQTETGSVQTVLDGRFTVVEKPKKEVEKPDWTREGLLSHIIELIVSDDQVSAESLRGRHALLT